MDKVNPAETSARIAKPWSPRIVGALNGRHVKLAKLKGEFTRHRHENEDGLFYVVGGNLTIRFRPRGSASRLRS